MRKNKLVIIILIIMVLLMINGCEKSESVDNSIDLITASSPTLTNTVAPTNSPAIEPTTTPTIESTTTPTITSTAEPTSTLEELSMDAYEKFIKNEMTISFDYYMPISDMDEDLYKRGSEYTLTEVLSIITANYFQGFDNKKIGEIDYSFIDCGNDGVNELAICFDGMDLYNENDGSTLVYIIKYIEGKLNLCYYYETWARSDSTLNVYGYIESGGSSSASNHVSDSGLIDKDGKWQQIVYIESELDIQQLLYGDDSNLGMIPEVSEKKGITDGIEVNSILIDENATNLGNADNVKRYYTFYAYDDNWNLINDAKLYTNSKYKDIFDEAKIPFITPGELSAMISEKEKKVGATAEIKEGAEITWKTLSGNMFSEYVGR